MKHELNEFEGMYSVLYAMICVSQFLNLKER